ncbi:hypothetical protein BGX34_005883, partial [Mortierella sp. NVP85]
LNLFFRISEMDLQMVTRRLANITSLIQENPGLRTLHMHGERLGQAKTLDNTFLKAIMDHSSLTKLRLDVLIPCFTMAKIMIHLPHQLRELEMDLKVFDSGAHTCQRCDEQVNLFKSRTIPLSLRRLTLQGSMQWFVIRLLLPLLQHCPDLEVLALPPIKRPDITDTVHMEMAQILDSHCPHLHTLSLPRNCSKKPVVRAKRVSLLLEEFSRGLRHLYLLDTTCGRPDHPKSRWNEQDVLKTLLHTATLNTLEVFKACPSSNDNGYLLQILRQCPRLREFQLNPECPRYAGMDLKDLISAMCEPWKSSGTLSVIQLKITNRSFTANMAPKSSKTGQNRRCESQYYTTDQAVRQLCFWLRDLPNLTTLHLHWNLNRNS